MENILNIIKNNVKIFIFILIIIIETIVIISLLFISFNSKIDVSEEVSEKIVYKDNNINDSEDNIIYVDIKGAVKKPGVYKVEEKYIINDVIKLAGGLKKGASTKNINLSKKVSNEMVIYIAYKNEFKSITCKENETLEVKESSSNLNYASSNTLVSDYNNVDANDNLIESNSNNNDNKTLVNINTASKEELLKVSGIGESKADSIIAYRLEKGDFKTIEDIKNVSGIGESLFAKIKNYITV